MGIKPFLNTLFSGHRQVSTDFYRHSVHEPFTNGAMEFGFIRRFPNPLEMHTGTGYIPSFDWAVEQPPQVYAALSVPPVWIGGVPGGAPMWQTELLNQDLTPITYNEPGVTE